MHPLQERLWVNQQRMQEVHRRRLYHRFSSHHVALVLYNIVLLYHILSDKIYIFYS